MKRGKITRKRQGSHAARGNKKTILLILALVAAVMAASGIVYYHAPETKATLSKAAVLGDTIAEEIPGRTASTNAFTVGRVTKVVSLNEIELESGGHKQLIRLLHVSATGSKLLPSLLDEMRGKLLNAQIRLEPNVQEGFDSGGRRLGYVMLEGENFNLQMVKNGWSQYDVSAGKSAKYDMAFRMAEADAKAHHAGLWTEK